MVYLQKLGLLAVCLASHASAARIGYMARQTDQAELQAKASTGTSPVPTSLTRPELAEMELLKRVYIMPSSICGWNDIVVSSSWVCPRNQSCINIGNYRGCCDGETTDCARTFRTACIPSVSFTTVASSEPSCPRDVLCCTGTEYPECGTVLFSGSGDDYSRTYTNLNCYQSGYDSTLYTIHMQDYPADPRTQTSSSSSSSPTSLSLSLSSSGTSTPTPSTATSSTSTPTPTPVDPQPNPAGAIAGGVVGGLAVIALCVLGIVYILRRRKGTHNPVPQQSPPPETAQNQAFPLSELPGGGTPDRAKTFWDPGKGQWLPVHEFPATPVDGNFDRAQLP